MAPCSSELAVTYNCSSIFYIKLGVYGKYSWMLHLARDVLDASRLGAFRVSEKRGRTTQTKYQALMGHYSIVSADLPSPSAPLLVSCSHESWIASSGHVAAWKRRLWTGVDLIQQRCQSLNRFGQVRGSSQSFYLLSWNRES